MAPYTENLEIKTRRGGLLGRILPPKRKIVERGQIKPGETRGLYTPNYKLVGTAAVDENDVLRVSPKGKGGLIFAADDGSYRIILTKKP